MRAKRRPVASSALALTVFVIRNGIVGQAHERRLLLDAEEKFFSIKQIAERWGMSEKTVSRAFSRGLKRHNFGGTERPDWRVALSDLAAFERSRREPSTAKPTKRPRRSKRGS